MRRLTISVVVAIPLLGSACGTASTTTEPLAPATGAVAGPDWDRPIAGGIEVAGAAEAGLPFTPNEPDGLGIPVRILIPPPDAVSAAETEIVWVYDHPKYGRFFLAQHVVERSTTEREYLELSSQVPGCKEIPATAEDEKNFGVGVGPRIECHAGGLSLRTIRGGVSALLHEGGVTTAVHWLEPVSGPGMETISQRFRDPALEIVVMGPAGALSAAAALEIAELV